MKAVKEVGEFRVIKFTLFSILSCIYSFGTFPPIRKIFLMLLGARIGNDTVLMNIKFFNWHHMGPKGIRIGKECFIGDETLIDLYDKVVLEDQVTIAQRVTVLTHLNVGYSDHPLQKFFPKTSKPVIFKKGSVVAAASTILPGVTIGEKSFVAAGSVVADYVPPNSLVAGVPAKLVRKLK